jgi:hypothetical protein
MTSTVSHCQVSEQPRAQPRHRHSVPQPPDSAAPRLYYAQGSDILTDSTTGFAAAENAARKADVVVLAQRDRLSPRPCQSLQRWWVCRFADHQLRIHDHLS